MIIERFPGISKFIGERFQKEVDERGIVKNSMNIGSHTSAVNNIAVGTAVFQKIQRRSRGTLGGDGGAHVDLITL